MIRFADRPLYEEALAALTAAHKACFNHPGRDVLGMSHGPFSGVNKVLGIVSTLEIENIRLKQQIATLTSPTDADRH